MKEKFRKENSVYWKVAIANNLIFKLAKKMKHGNEDIVGNKFVKNNEEYLI